MSKCHNELAKIERPKLLMATAKVLVEKRKFAGKIGRTMSQSELQKLLTQETNMEEQRITDPALYHVNRHIEVLASLIEQVYAHQKTAAHL